MPTYDYAMDHAAYPPVLDFLPRYEHDPYNGKAPTNCYLRALKRSPSKGDDPCGLSLSHGMTIHAEVLKGSVSFVRYPDNEQDLFDQLQARRLQMRKQEAAAANGGRCKRDSRVFLGHLPVGSRPDMVEWVFNCLFGAQIIAIDEITKHHPLTGKLFNTGSFHARTDNRSFMWLRQFVHKRVLFDVTGIWIANSFEEQVRMDEYVETLGNWRQNMLSLGVPFRTVVVETAISKSAMALGHGPGGATGAHHAAAAGSHSTSMNGFSSHHGSGYWSMSSMPTTPESAYGQHGAAAPVGGLTSPELSFTWGVSTSSLVGGPTTMAAAAAGGSGVGTVPFPPLMEDVTTPTMLKQTTSEDPLSLSLV